MYFDNWNSFMMNQNKNYALKNKDIETIVVSPPQSYAHHDINEINIDIMKKKKKKNLA